MLTTNDLQLMREQLGRMSQALADMQRLTSRMMPHVNIAGPQYDELPVLLDLLDDESGSYVDVGAGEPIECNNTWPFYNRGWRGLLIEPSPYAWASLMLERPHDILLPLAISDYDGIAEFRHCATVGSLRADWEIHEHHRSMVQVTTLDHLLARFPEIRDSCQFCSIDVEGVEGSVLHGINFDTFHPKVFMLEYRTYSERGNGIDTRYQWEHLLTSRGYSMIHKNDLNVIYARQERDNERIGADSGERGTAETVDGQNAEVPTASERQADDSLDSGVAT